ncbi:MAG: DEAD/DEAH box helicase [Lentisphaeria bacterium]|nr:DEAD/DEAH box helicase [Lentisphaeria bacterium]
MIPSIISQQVRGGIEDFLRTTFPIHTPFFSGVLEGLLAPETGQVFKGPYVTVKLPFSPGAGGKDVFPDVPLRFPPYQHQEKAFARLGANPPQSTIIATGTGSGKTECFMYPLLADCYARRGIAGIKAIIIYPMNALATDQAKRFAQEIHSNPKLKKTVRVGLYVGDKGGGKGTAMMSEDHVITDRETLRAAPPDILLTNYKMLDYLLIRPRDAELWKDNEPDTLRYMVVDELHTFDGAQGTDLACLIRRLKNRLHVPQRNLCCIGTSATLGDTTETSRLREYAGEVFGETFDDKSVITEETLSAEEFFANSMIHMATRFPRPDQADSMMPDNYADINAYLQGQIPLWFDKDGENFGMPDWRLQLGDRLLGHGFFRNLLSILSRKPYTVADLLQELERYIPEGARGDKECGLNRIGSLLALTGFALREGNDPIKRGSEDWEALSDAEKLKRCRPLVDIRLQLWLRELRRLVCSVREQPVLRFADDLNMEEGVAHLPLVHCRECGETGWLGVKRTTDTRFGQDLQKVYEGFFNYSPTTHFLFPGGTPALEESPAFDHYFCGNCLHLTSGTGLEKCPSCGDEGQLIKVYASNPRRQVRGGTRQVSSHNCPYCLGQESLTVMGSRAASLVSVGISQLFTSVFNADRKLLAFSDSVQDAAHRAGFFGARTYRFTFRTALQQFVATRKKAISLADLPAKMADHYAAALGEPDFIATFLAPDMAWLQDYEQLKITGKLRSGSDLPDLIRERIGWEVFSEYAFRSRIGRTLEKSSLSVAGVDIGGLRRACGQVADTIRNGIGGMESVTEEQLLGFCIGFLNLMKSKGAVWHPALNAYVDDLGGYYHLNKGRNELFMPRFGLRTRTPIFLTTHSGTRFDQLLSGGRASHTWYEDWAKRNFGKDCPLVAQFAGDLYHPLLEALVKEGILGRRLVKDKPVWGIQPRHIVVGADVKPLRCGVCGHGVAAPESELPHWLKLPCLRIGCKGDYNETSPSTDYYARLYSSGRPERLVAEEHTALLDGDARTKVEESFKHRQYGWEPNLISCTPTLEMGIDIGDLSSVLLCNVPPNQASYLQRIGRSGRRDGRSFNLTVAGGQPHDLFFYAEPLQMIAGTVGTPGCFLSASAVLQRQFTAFCFDRWVASGIPNNAIPAKLSTVIANLGKKNPALFPFSLLGYIDLHRIELLDDFIALFENMPEDTAEKLRSFVLGEGGHSSGVRMRILEELEDIAKELKAIRGRVKILREAIKKLETSDARDADYEQQLEDLEMERNAMVGIARSITGKQTYNYFTDIGLLPNYAFPEAGVQLRSVILRRRKAGEGRKFDAKVYEYERPAKSAIHELAPSNAFYGEGRKVVVDQVDMRLSEVEAWRCCDSCPHMEQVKADVTPSSQCPNCGSPGWADNGQVRQMLRMHQVVATTKDNESRIRDESDDREPQFFNKHMVVNVQPTDVTCAFAADSKDMPFGYEFCRHATFREINFGNKATLGEMVTVAGHEVNRDGFRICSKCGKVVTRKKGKDTINHAVGCPLRGRDAETPSAIMECIYLYRQFHSEAIRFLLPTGPFSGTAKNLQSFIAALLMGLREHFHGNIDHIACTVQEEPLEAGSQARKRYLLLYDCIPGGTGYLKELVNSPENLMDLLQRALEILEQCECRDAADKDGCYRCLYAYRGSFEIPNISRTAAIDCLRQVLAERDNLVPIESVTGIKQNAHLESELEAFFIEALREARYEGRRVELKKEIVNCKSGWYLNVGDRGYFIEPQLDLKPPAVPLTTRPDFIVRPEKRSETLPIALYLDGFDPHADLTKGPSKVGNDMAKRMGLIRSGKYHVWSLTWNDLKNRDEGTDPHFDPIIPSRNQKQQKLIAAYDADSGVAALGDLNHRDSFSALIDYLASPDPVAWQTSAAIQSMMFLGKEIVDLDALKQEVSLLLGEDHPLEDAFVQGFENERVLLGANSPKMEAAKHWVSILACTTATAVREKRFADVGAICHFGDTGTEIQNGYREAWNGFLRLQNLFQFLPRAIFVTAQGLVDGDYDALEFFYPNDSKDKDSAGGKDSQVQLDGYAEILDESLLSTLRILAKQGIQPPGIDDIPFELCDEKGGIVGEAELAWADKRIAFIYAGQEESIAAFKSAGWKIFTIEELTAAPDAFGVVLKG